MFRTLKKKDIRINGRRVTADLTLSEGDEVAVYLPDESLTLKPDDISVSFPSTFQTTPSHEAYEPREIYRGPDLLIVDKPQGMAVHAGARVLGTPLVDLLRERYGTPELTLCHRLDQGTGGLVMLAFGRASLEAALDLMERQRLVKTYRCLVLGVWDAADAGSDGFCTRNAWLEKPDKGGRVFIHDAPASGRLPVCTRVRLLHTWDVSGAGPVSELEVELVTGRTHQIRAHLSWLGHPVLGDGLYGRNADNRRFLETDGGKVRRQQLFATRLLFQGIEKNHRLAYLANRRFEIEPKYTVRLEGL
ncbi:MAG: RluA family pseudouridine synthase [Clostridiaceae bacterium]|nr:RluA family pseudouridine synthase [Clostridiaceae bacterium]